MKDVKDVLRTMEIAIRQCSNAEIEERLIPHIFDKASQRLGTGRAQQIFGKLSSDTYANDLAVRRLVVAYLLIADVRVDRGKGNFAPPSAQGKAYQFTPAK